MNEREYIEECPECDTRFIGMSPEEWRETHAREDCDSAPHASLIYFPLKGPAKNTVSNQQ